MTYNDRRPLWKDFKDNPIDEDLDIDYFRSEEYLQDVYHLCLSFWSIGREDGLEAISAKADDIIRETILSDIDDESVL
jgi:hypothetical protein